MRIWRSQTERGMTRKHYWETKDAVQSHSHRQVLPTNTILTSWLQSTDLFGVTLFPLENKKRFPCFPGQNGYPDDIVMSNKIDAAISKSSFGSSSLSFPVLCVEHGQSTNVGVAIQKGGS